MIVRLLIVACLLVLPRWAFALDIQSVKTESGIERRDHRQVGVA